MESVQNAMSSECRIGITLPPNHGVGTGNLRTAQRWIRILSDLGHEVRLFASSDDLDCEILLALNAVKSFETLSRFHKQNPEGRVIVAVTGTDLNRSASGEWRAATDWADRVIVLQEKAYQALDPRIRAKTVVMNQSVTLPAGLGKKSKQEGFQVVVVGHLRDEKDPMLAGMAARLLDDDSRVRILQAGAILEEKYRTEVMDEQAMNPRYQWLGELPRRETLELIVNSQLMVLSSISEGGPAVIGESVMAGTPILASKIDGVVGLLGEDYPGYFNPGDAIGLSKLLRRAENEQAFYSELIEATEAKQKLFDPARESQAWVELLKSLD